MSESFNARAEICLMRMLVGEMIASPLSVSSSSGFECSDVFMFMWNGMRHAYPVDTQQVSNP